MSLTGSAVDSTVTDFLLSLARHDRAAATPLLAEVIEPRFVQLCVDQHLGPYLYGLASQLPWLELSPETELDLKLLYLEQWSRNARLLKPLAELQRSFSEAGMAFILLKGPYLAQRLYGDLAHRAMADVDILVRREELRPACERLRLLGFERTSRLPLAVETSFRFTHALDFVRDGIEIELHHALRSEPSLKISEDDLWAGGHTELDGLRYRVLPDAYSLLLQLLSIREDVGLATVTLRSFLDLYLLLREVDLEMSWADFFAARRHEGTLGVSVNVIDLFLSVFGTAKEFPELAESLAAHRDRLVVSGSRERYLEILTGSLWVKKGWAMRSYDRPFPLVLTRWLLNAPLRAVTHAHANVFARGRSIGLPMHAPTEPFFSTPTLEALGLERAAFDERIVRFGSLTTRIHSTSTLYFSMLEELFRLDLEDAESVTAEQDVALEVYLFDIGKARLRNAVRRPDRALDLHGGITQIHQRIVSAYVRSGEPCPTAVMPVMAEGHSYDLIIHSLMLVFYKLLFLFGRVHLHAASVAHPDGASLFVGGKGAGKSTISLALGRAGATVLGEDHVVVRRTEEGFAASGCDDLLRVTAETERHFFGEISEVEAVDFAGTPKKEISLRDHLSASAWTDRRIDRILFPRVRERFEIGPLAPAAALTRIFSAINDRHSFAEREDLQDLLDFFAELVESAELFDLTLSRDLDDLDQLVEFFQS